MWPTASKKLECGSRNQVNGRPGCPINGRNTHAICAPTNPNAMTLATATLEGLPAARIVLCKDVVGVPGYVVFYTNFQSCKGLELADNPRAAAVLHWDHMHRQVRIEGLVETAVVGGTRKIHDARRR